MSLRFVTGALVCLMVLSMNILLHGVTVSNSNLALANASLHGNAEPPQIAPGEMPKRTFDADNLGIREVLLRGQISDGKCTFSPHTLKIRPVKGFRRKVVLRTTPACDMIVEALKIEKIANQQKILFQRLDGPARVSTLLWRGEDARLLRTRQSGYGFVSAQTYVVASPGYTQTYVDLTYTYNWGWVEGYGGGSCTAYVASQDNCEGDYSGGGGNTINAFLLGDYSAGDYGWLSYVSVTADYTGFNVCAFDDIGDFPQGAYAENTCTYN